MSRLVRDCDVCQSVLVHLTGFAKRLMHVICCFRNRTYGETYAVARDRVRHIKLRRSYVLPNHQEFGLGVAWAHVPSQEFFYTPDHRPNDPPEQD